MPIPSTSVVVGLPEPALSVPAPARDGALPGLRRRGARICAGLGALLALGAAWPLGAQEAPAGAVPPPTTNAASLSLADLTRRVLEHNETVQAKLIDFEANQRKYAAERGIFEPDGFLTASREITNRQNSTSQAAADNGVSVLHERNTSYETGVEQLVPTGAKLRLGYSLGDLRNNIPPGAFQAPLEGSQFQSFAGATLTQPLLRNFGPKASLAGIRLAALSSKIAFQEYRRQLMTIVGTTEATYWNLRLAQEQVRFFEESVRTAETILRDNRERLDAGKGSELEVLEAQAGAGLRRAKLNEARQRALEATNRVMSLYGGNALVERATFTLVDAPALAGETIAETQARQLAFDLNPDYLIQREKIQQEQVRLGYARNQRLPQLDFKGSYGLNGLGTTPRQSLDWMNRAQYPSWSLGVEVHLPLLGGIKGRNESKAAQLQVTAAELAIHALEIDMLNGIDTAWHKVESARSSVASYQDSVTYNKGLLDSALARLQAGKIESRKVFEIEADLLEARSSEIEALVRYKLAQLELELIAGTILQNRRLEITQRQLQQATEKFGRAHQVGDGPYQQALQAVLGLYQPHAAAPARQPN
jgi:outer membrane protein TolC